MLTHGKKILTNKKGQSATEYIIVAVGLMGAFLSFYVLYSHLVPQQFEQGAKFVLMDYSAGYKFNNIGGLMKFIVALQNKADMLKAKAFSTLTKKEGQNTVEYVLMLVVVVGIALGVGAAVKSFMPEVYENVKQKILGGVNSAA